MAKINLANWYSVYFGRVSIGFLVVSVGQACNFKGELLMIKDIKAYSKKIIIELAKYVVLKNVNHSHYDKKCLLAYITKPFIKGTKASHPNYFEAKAIAAVLDELNYDVDVCFFCNDKFKNFNKYDLIIGLGDSFDNSINKVRGGKNVARVFYATGANFISSFYNEIERWIDLYDKKGIIVAPSRFGLPKNPQISIQSMKSVDGIITVGGQWCASTYNMWGKCIYQVGVIPFTKYSYTDMNRNISLCRCSFLWLGGKGLVHKGLDIILETFVRMSNYNLYIACNYEKGFWDKYADELNKENIHYVGFVNTNSSKFYELANKCAYTIGTSCSEGTCTSIVTCMCTGLIPITSKESGIDYGHVIDDCNSDSIVEMITELNKKSDEEIQADMERTYKYVSENYTEDIFRRKFKYALHNILKEKYEVLAE